MIDCLRVEYNTINYELDEIITREDYIEVEDGTDGRQDIQTAICQQITFPKDEHILNIIKVHQ